MKKDIKNFGKWIEIIFIILTFISLIIDAFEYTYLIYNMSYDAMKLNDFLISKPFTITLWIDNILIIIFGIFYIIDTIQQKKNVFLKLSFCIFSICTTMIVASFIINGIAKMFGLF
jgi:hypothetical protein